MGRYRFTFCIILSLCSVLIGQEPNVKTHPWSGLAPSKAPEKADTAQLRPERRDFSEELLKQLKLPEGFRINVFAKELGNARMPAVDTDGTVYLTCPGQDRAMALTDRDGDGKAEIVKTAFEGLDSVHGIYIYRDSLYLAGPTTVWLCKREENKWSKPKVIIDDLPPGPSHQNRTLGVGPDEKLYISVGSSCNACVEKNPEYATILVAELDGSKRKIFAKGLRNTIGFGWHPISKQMWGMDHGSDWRGNDMPPEELNLLKEGKDYGWPYVMWKQVPDPFMEPPGMSKEEYAKRTEPAVLGHTAHSSPIGFTFYTGRQFPDSYRNSAFVVFRGSWNRNPASGYKIAFLKFDDKGQPVKFEDFVTGFLIEEGKAQFARLSGINVLKDGSLIFADDENGVIYRVSYVGKK